MYYGTLEIIIVFFSASLPQELPNKIPSEIPRISSLDHARLHCAVWQYFHFVIHDSAFTCYCYTLLPIHEARQTVHDHKWTVDPESIPNWGLILLHLPAAHLPTWRNALHCSSGSLHAHIQYGPWILMQDLSLTAVPSRISRRGLRSPYLRRVRILAAFLFEPRRMSRTEPDNCWLNPNENVWELSTFT
jgi:hypothetical protein